MARDRNPRRVVLPVLRAMAQNVRSMITVWDGPRKTTVEVTRNGRCGYRELVTAPADRQPENVAEDWERLAQFMSVIAQQATDVRKYAESQAKRCRGEV